MNDMDWTRRSWQRRPPCSSTIPHSPQDGTRCQAVTVTCENLTSRWAGPESLQIKNRLLIYTTFHLTSDVHRIPRRLCPRILEMSPNGEDQK